MKPILVVETETKRYTILKPTSSEGVAVCLPETDMPIESMVASCPVKWVEQDYPCERIDKNGSPKLAILVDSTPFFAAESVWKQYERKGAVIFLEEDP